MDLIITSCSARKDDTIPIPNGSKTVPPRYYLEDEELIRHLKDIRHQIFQDPRARLGTQATYAFDLYVRTGNAYKDLREHNYQPLKSMLFSGEIEWFFLSGGYGIINALEPAKKYQATFNRNIAYQKNIPFTANLWKETLPKICDEIISKLNPEHVYAFGSRDYTNFIKQTHFWRKRNSSQICIKMFESTGSAGPYWLSPILNELVNSILRDNINTFNKKHAPFVKQ